MKRLIITLCLIISLALGSFGVGWSGDFQKDMDAYDKGDYETALKKWIPLAKNNHKKAQNDKLWLTFKNVNGVP